MVVQKQVIELNNDFDIMQLSIIKLYNKYKWEIEVENRLSRK